jgi:hypothetical protein
MGYVVKAEAATELLAAVEAVCQGRQFVTPELPLAPPTERPIMQP